MRRGAHSRLKIVCTFLHLPLANATVKRAKMIIPRCFMSKTCRVITVYPVRGCQNIVFLGCKYSSPIYQNSTSFTDCCLGSFALLPPRLLPTRRVAAMRYRVLSPQCLLAWKVFRQHSMEEHLNRQRSYGTL